MKLVWCCGAVVLVTAGAECDSSSSKSENSSSGVQRHYRILACRRFSVPFLASCHYHCLLFHEGGLLFCFEPSEKKRGTGRLLRVMNN